MPEAIDQDNFRASVNRRLAGMKGDPQLAERIMNNEKKETETMRKPVMTMVFAFALLCVLSAGALAAALGAWGVMDFAGQYTGAYVPPQYGDCIVREDRVIETAHVTCTVQESYYDGRVLRVTAHVAPKERVLLLTGDMLPNDPHPLHPEMSLAGYAQLHHGGRMADVSLSGVYADSQSGVLHEDGSVTLYLQCIFDDEQPVRNAELSLVYMPVIAQADGSSRGDASARAITSIPMTFEAVPVKTYVCRDAMSFPGAGVQVTKVTLTVTPLEIRYVIEYAITDMTVYQAHDHGLWFEFVDDGTAVSEGLTGSASAGRADGLHFEPDETGTVYRQSGTIGLDAFGGQYAIRAYAAADKTRFETVVFTVTEAE